MLPKGQQKLTTFSDLVEEGISYLQLFLELPETVWSLQNRSYIKKHHFLDSMSPFVKANLSFGLIYEAKSEVGEVFEDFQINKSEVGLYNWI